MAARAGKLSSKPEWWQGWLRQDRTGQHETGSVLCLDASSQPKVGVRFSKETSVCREVKKKQPSADRAWPDDKNFLTEMVTANSVPSKKPVGRGSLPQQPL